MTNSEAIETLKANYPDSCYGQLREAVDTAIYALSVQPTQNDTSNALKSLDCIERQAAIQALDNAAEQWNIAEPYHEGMRAGFRNSARLILSLPSAEPEISLHESCMDCPLYDKDRHSCPRFNKVIPETLREAQPEQRWIPVTERLPDVGQRVLCQCRARIMDVLRLTEDGSWKKTYSHAEYMSGFVVAWMPLPESYKGGQE